MSEDADPKHFSMDVFVNPETGKATIRFAVEDHGWDPQVEDYATVSGMLAVMIYGAQQAVNLVEAIEAEPTAPQELRISARDELKLRVGTLVSYLRERGLLDSRPPDDELPPTSSTGPSAPLA